MRFLALVLLCAVMQTVAPKAGISAAEANRTIVIQEAVPVSGWTKAYVILTGLLVVVGAAGALYAIKTLSVIQRQAVSMRRQTTHLKNSVIQAKRAANAARQSAAFAEAATKASERADILLEAVGIVTSASGVVDGDSLLKVTYKNFGRTRAKDVRFKIELLIEGVDLGNAVQELPPIVMGPGQHQTIAFQTFRECLTLPTFRQIVEGKIALRFVAWIVYEDVFGAYYTTRDSGIFDARALRFRVEQQIAG